MKLLSTSLLLLLAACASTTDSGAGKGGDSLADTTLTLDLTKDGRIVHEGQWLKFSGLRPLVESLSPTGPVAVTLNTEAGTTTSLVAAVRDELNGGGASQVRVLQPAPVRSPLTVARPSGGEIEGQGGQIEEGDSTVVPEAEVAGAQPEAQLAEPGEELASSEVPEIPGESQEMAPVAMALSASATKTPDLPQEVARQLSSDRFKRWFASSYLSETDIEPKITIPERDVLQEVMEALSEERPAEALALLEEEGGENPSPTFEFYRGNIHFQAEANEAAIAAYDNALEQFPKFLRAWKNKGISHLREGDFDRARQAFTQVVQLGGADAVIFGLLGWCYTSAEQWLPAESAYRMAILLDPDSFESQMGLARSLFKQDRFDVAASLVGQLLASNPDNASLWKLQANAYLGMKQPMKAAENYEIIESLKASTSETLNNLADIYRFEGLHGLAVDRFLAALERDEGLDAGRALAGAQQIAMAGSAEEAKRLLSGIEALRSAELADRDRKLILQTRARLAAVAGATDEEASILAEVVALDPLDGDAMIRLGIHERTRENDEAAIMWFERAAGLEEFEAEAKSQHGQLLTARGDYAAALVLLRRALELAPRESLQEYVDSVTALAGSSRSR